MENFRYASHPCVFQWNVENPFLPWQRIESTFYSRFPTLIQWKVTLRPMGRRIKTRIFSFSLSCEEFDENDIVLASRIQVDISLGEKRVATEEVLNFWFERGNWRTFYFETSARRRYKLEPPCLFIKVEINLQGQPNLFPSGWSLDEDLVVLSEDLNRLVTDECYSNMKLFPSDGLDAFHVHSCIIDARWNNFFSFHSWHETDQDTVETNISEGVLSDILTYMYSGRFATLNWPDWKDAAYIAELFQVIDRYKLYHLHKVFVKSDSQQLQETRRALVTSRRDFPLDKANGQPLDDLTYRWYVDEPGEYNLIFQIEIFIDEEDARLSYSLHSRSSFRIHANVHLEFLKKTKITRIWDSPNLAESLSTSFVVPNVESVHDRDFQVDNNETVESEEVHFIHDHYIFDDFHTDRDDPAIRSNSKEIWHFIRCNLNLSDGSTVMQVKNMSDGTIQNDQERFSVLSDSMYALLSRPLEADLRINCPAEVPRNPNNPKDKINVEYTHRLHKAIFATRVPEYWSVLQNVPRGSEIPEVVSCNLQSEAFSAVLLYIYTGKFLAFPLTFLDEIYLFAQRSGFISLQNLVNRMRDHRANH